MSSVAESLTLHRAAAWKSCTGHYTNNCQMMVLWIPERTRSRMHCCFKTLAHNDDCLLLAKLWAHSAGAAHECHCRHTRNGDM